MLKAKELQGRIEEHRNALADLAKNAGVKSETALSRHQAEIMVAASQLAEISTGRLVRLTWALVGLTLVLLLLTIFLYKDAHEQAKHEQLSHQGSMQKP